MSITLDYGKLPKSTVVAERFVVDDKECQCIDIQAPGTFVTDVMVPILRMLSADNPPYVFSYYVASAVMPPKAEAMQCTLIYLRKSRQYNSAFDLFSRFGINLSGLWLGYCSHTNTLYIPKKIHQFINKLDGAQQAEYAMTLLYYYRFLRALTKSKSDWTECSISSASSISNMTFRITSETLGAIIKDTQPTMDSESINIDTLSDDMAFQTLLYIKTPKAAQLPLALGTVSFPTTGLVYNAIESNGSRYLCIVNKMFKPAAYYVIDLNRNLIATNMELQSYNTTSDGAEFIPQLMGICMKAKEDDPTKSLAFGIVNMELGALLDTVLKHDEFEVSADMGDFEKIIDCIPNISENYDPTLYDCAHSPRMSMRKASIGADLASEYDADAYAQTLYAQNQSYYDTFDLGELTNVVKGLASKGQDQIYSMLFEGETGTGKSTAARVMFCKIGLPWISINCSTNIDEADIFGSMIPNPMKKDASDPEFIWQDGPATKAIRNGYGLIIEEGNGARPGVLLKFNSLLDEARQIELGNGEVIKAHPNFRLVFTSNIAYEGTNILNKAFVDRFNIVHKFDDLSKTAAVAVIKSRTGYSDATKIEKVYGVYEAVKKYSKEQNLGLAISIRRLMDVFTKGKFYKTAAIAVRDLLLDHAFLQEPEHLDYFVNTVLPSFSLAFKI